MSFLSARAKSIGLHSTGKLAPLPAAIHALATTGRQVTTRAAQAPPLAFPFHFPGTSFRPIAVPSPPLSSTKVAPSQLHFRPMFTGPSWRPSGVRVDLYPRFASVRAMQEVVTGSGVVG